MNLPVSSTAAQAAGGSRLALASPLSVRFFGGFGVLDPTDTFRVWLGDGFAFRTTVFVLSWLPIWLTMARRSSSIGIATSVGGALPDELVDAADRSLYQAKAEGRGRWHVSTDEERSDPPAPTERVAGEG